jgi:enoyl-CoA hydratase/carnithine racemase
MHEKFIDTTKAHAMGLIDKMVEETELVDEAQKLTTMITSKSSLIIR